MQIPSNKIMKKTCFGIIFVLHVSPCVFMCVLCTGNYFAFCYNAWGLWVYVCVYIFFLAVYMHEYRVFQCDRVSLQHKRTPCRSQSTLGSINRKKEIFLFLFEHYSHATPRQNLSRLVPLFAWHKTDQVWSGRTPTLKGDFTHLSLFWLMQASIDTAYVYNVWGLGHNRLPMYCHWVDFICPP